MRRAAATAVGALGLKTAIDPLVNLASDRDPTVRRASFDSLRRLREPRVVPMALAALAEPETQVAALRYIAELGAPSEADAVADLAKRSPTAEVLPLAVRTLTEWSRREGLSMAQRPELNHAVAEVQGATGLLVRWEVTTPIASGLAFNSWIARPERPANPSSRRPAVRADGRS